MRFVAAVLMLSLAFALPSFACEKPASSGGESSESVPARTVFNRITPEGLETDAAAKKAYGCRYIFADVSGGMERARPTAGGLPKAPIGADGRPKAGKVLVAYIITVEGVAADPVVIESTDSQLTDAALEAMQAWRFQPASFNGRAVASLAAQEFPFAATGP